MKTIKTQIQTHPNPDFESVKQFKDAVYKTLKKGWKLDGSLIINEDGSYKQNFFKRER